MNPTPAARQSVTAWVLSVVKALVRAPEDISLESVGSNDALPLVIRSAEADVGRLVGKETRTLSALQTLAAAAGALRGLRINIEIVGRRGRSPA